MEVICEEKSSWHMDEIGRFRVIFSTVPIRSYKILNVFLDIFEHTALGISPYIHLGIKSIAGVNQHNYIKVNRPVPIYTKENMANASFFFLVNSAHWIVEGTLSLIASINWR